MYSSRYSSTVQQNTVIVFRGLSNVLLYSTCSFPFTPYLYTTGLQLMVLITCQGYPIFFPLAIAWWTMQRGVVTHSMLLLPYHSTKNALTRKIRNIFAFAHQKIAGSSRCASFCLCTALHKPSRLFRPSSPVKNSKR